MNHATELLRQSQDGDARAANQLMPLIYDELRRLAGDLLSHERRDHTLQATALVNEAYMKLVDQDRAVYADELHFGAIACQAMRRVLVDHARRRNRAKRSGGSGQVTLAVSDVVDRQYTFDATGLEDSIAALREEDARAAQVVELRYFGGFTIQRTADFLGVSNATVEREWKYARAWLFVRLAGGGDSNAS